MFAGIDVASERHMLARLDAQGVPLGEAGQASDIADAVLFLASDASRHMTGSEVVVDGGMTAGRVGSLAAAR